MKKINKSHLRSLTSKIGIVLSTLFIGVAMTSVVASAASTDPYPNCTDTGVSKPCCGGAGSQTQTSIDLGCKGQGNTITDLTFAIIRFLTNGVAVVLVASMVYAGIQYSSSRADPNATAQAIGRIRSNVFALLLFIFAYAILNYIIPGQVLGS